MRICQGAVRSRNLKKTCPESTTTMYPECLLCSNYITGNQTKLTCLNPSCELIAHITCLADLFLEPGEYIPIKGDCPFCSTNLKWGDLIRKMKGCEDGNNGNTDNDNADVNDNADANDDEDSDEDCVSIKCSQDHDFVDNNSRWFLECDDDL